jgi:membrane protease YdiL (CAAX protease family)
MLSALLSSVLQVLVLTGIAWLAWLAFGRRSGPFREWVGLFPPRGRTVLEGVGVGLLGAAALLALFLSPAFHAIAAGPNTPAGKLRAIDSPTVAAVSLVLYATLQTALAEEIFFRGFVAKRLIRWLGWVPGSVIQALLFGGLHLLLFAGPGAAAFSASRALAVLAITSVLGWALAWLNEKRGNGSILPGWAAHATVNLITYGVLVFGPP